MGFPACLGPCHAGVQPGNVVATLLPNTPAHAEAHFGVPACGAVLNAINTRLDVDTVRYILGHGAAKVLLADGALLDLARAACAALDAPPRIIEVADTEAGFAPTGELTDYEGFLDSGDPHFAWVLPQDEWESLALNYTSGTIGRPKGVVYHHRGAYLSTLSQPMSWRMTLFPRYLTIVPMFHCNACRERLAGFKTPKLVVFIKLPKTSTGKIRKFELRAQVRDL